MTLLFPVRRNVAMTAGLRQYYVDGKLDYTDRESLTAGNLKFVLLQDDTIYAQAENFHDTF